MGPSLTGRPLPPRPLPQRLPSDTLKYLRLTRENTGSTLCLQEAPCCAALEWHVSLAVLTRVFRPCPASPVGQRLF